jgi:hypothetical protein
VRPIGRRCEAANELCVGHVLEHGVDDFEVHSLVPQGELKMTHRRRFERDVAWEPESIVRRYSPIH